MRLYYLLVACLLWCAPASGQEVASLIRDLGAQKYTTRRDASAMLLDLLKDDWTAYPAVSAAIADPETSLEASRRLLWIRRLYFQHCFGDLFQEFEVAVPAVYGGGRKLADAYELSICLPQVYVWYLPRSERYIDDKDHAHELYEEAIITLNTEFGVPLDPARLNTEVAMLYATHIWCFEWMESGQNPASARSLLLNMLTLQEIEQASIKLTTGLRQWRGRIEVTTPPAPVEDRPRLLQDHQSTPIPPTPPLRADNTRPPREPDPFDFGQFPAPHSYYFQGALPPEDELETCR